MKAFCKCLTFLINLVVLLVEYNSCLGAHRDCNFPKFNNNLIRVCAVYSNTKSVKREANG